MLQLQEPSFGREEILEVLDSLLSGKISMGEKNKKFEKKWIQWLYCNYTSSCNSGSSANLLIFSALKSPLFNQRLNDGDEVIITPVSWSTSYFPIIQSNLKCNLVDIDLDTFNIDVDKIEENINKKTKVIMIVHLLGSPCNMDKVLKLCNKYNLILIEDCCESYGALWNEKKIGTFGLASSFSFMFAHHICTAEGGMVSTNNKMFNDIIKIKRAHGWIRDILSENMKDKFISMNPNIDKKFLFVDTGYNLRMNDIQAGMGIHQIKKINKFIKIRRKNHFYLCRRIKEEGLDKYISILQERENQFLSPLAFPIVAKTIDIKNKLIKIFKKHKIETRGITAGNIIKQPFIKNYSNFFIYKDLPNANIIHNNGFWIGNHQGVNINDYEKVVQLMKEGLE